MMTTTTNTPTSTTTAATVTPPPPSESLTFCGISKHFNMPIADAAAHLGVCSSVLKKICRDNGLVRWPYRKFLAGKSVEEIQKDAARERKREMLELARAARQKDAATNPDATTNPSHQQGNIPANLQSQGNNTQQYTVPQDGWSSDMVHSGISRNIPAYLDEFKQGFPSNGLSTVTLRWWGARSPDVNEDEILVEEPATEETNTQQSHDLADTKEEFKDEENDTVSDKSGIVPQGTSLLLSVRERTAAEGREALKLGVYGGHRSFKLSGREKMLLVKVFKSSFPSQWKLDSL